MKINANGYFVMCPDGQIGLAVDRDDTYEKSPRITVQFGSSGPFRIITEGSLRYATEQEVRDAGLYGVGGEFGP